MTEYLAVASGQLDELRTAVGSPECPVEHEDDLLATQVLQPIFRPRRRGQHERDGGIPDRPPVDRGRGVRGLLGLRRRCRFDHNGRSGGRPRCARCRGLDFRRGLGSRRRRRPRSGFGGGHGRGGWRRGRGRRRRRDPKVRHSRDGRLIQGDGFGRRWGRW